MRFSPIDLDAAKQQGQDETIIAFEEQQTLSIVTETHSLMMKPVIDIREVQFEHCRPSNYRKEVSAVKSTVLPDDIFIDRSGKPTIGRCQLW
jgi:hypothetical protein